jgi:hypothetical protein
VQSRIYPYKTLHFNAKKGGKLVEVLRIAADSSPKSIAGALTAILKEESFVELQAVGAGA